MVCVNFTTNNTLRTLFTRLQVKKENQTSGSPFAIVAYRPVAMRRLCKQRPILGNGSVNTFPQQRIRTQAEKGLVAAVVFTK
jgi:hypothetical protein